MKTLLLIACALSAIGGATTDASACALKLPTFEVTGFPISPNQAAVVAGLSANVQERSPTPTLTLAGMPASPHQIAVLTARSKPIVTASAGAQLASLRTAPSLRSSIPECGRE